MKRSLCMLGLALCVGCATAIVRPYVGEQQNWPTATGSIVNTRYELPVFTSLPPAAYDILAEMRIESPFYAQPEEGHLPLLVKKAKTLGADALVFVEGQVYFAANYGSRTTVAAEGAGGQQPTLTQVNRFNPESFKQGVTIIAVKWTGEPPPGLPKEEKKKAAKAPEAPAAPVAPATPPVAEPALAPTPAPEVAPAPVPVPETPPAVTNTPPATSEPPKAEEPAAPAAPAPAPPPAPANP